MPRWAIWIFQAQIGLVCFFAGVAKLTPDWLHGLPIENMLCMASALPLLGPHIGAPEVILALAWAGMVLDLVAFPMLMIRRWRPWITLALLVFHLTNASIWNLGIFPWFMLATTPIWSGLATSYGCGAPCRDRREAGGHSAR